MREKKEGDGKGDRRGRLIRRVIGRERGVEAGSGRKGKEVEGESSEFRRRGQVKERRQSSAAAGKRNGRVRAS
eukprot:3221423-Rhodomonas_salina.1